ncbi:hypothetical protein ACH50O_08670 [Methylomonas sp. 2BW1-5-20]|uniref:hypothetical protein n=1 Tax=Methylomonas sp. 2BW1-5-20 TaxID=3376686 RepID=UPI0040533B05
MDDRLLTLNKWGKSMKMILSLKHWAAICLFAVSTASSASVWAPTSNVASFFATNLLGQPVFTGTFGIFEDTADISQGNFVVSFTGFDAVTFTANGGNYDVSTLFSKNTGQLSGSSSFKIGYLSNTGWKSELFNSDEVEPFITFGFGTGNSFNNLKLLVAAGIQAVESPITAVPLPASVWMMTSALLGLLYTGRRKAVVNA